MNEQNTLINITKYITALIAGLSSVYIIFPEFVINLGILWNSYTVAIWIFLILSSIIPAIFLCLSLLLSLDGEKSYLFTNYSCCFKPNEIFTDKFNRICNPVNALAIAIIGLPILGLIIYNCCTISILYRFILSIAIIALIIPIVILIFCKIKKCKIIYDKVFYFKLRAKACLGTIAVFLIALITIVPEVFFSKQDDKNFSINTVSETLCNKKCTQDSIKSLKSELNRKSIELKKIEITNPGKEATILNSINTINLKIYSEEIKLIELEKEYKNETVKLFSVFKIFVIGYFAIITQILIYLLFQIKLDQFKKNELDSGNEYVSRPEKVFNFNKKSYSYKLVFSERKKEVFQYNEPVIIKSYILLFWLILIPYYKKVSNENIYLSSPYPINNFIGGNKAETKNNGGNKGEPINYNEINISKLDEDQFDSLKSNIKAEIRSIKGGLYNGLTKKDLESIKVIIKGSDSTFTDKNFENTLMIFKAFYVNGFPPKTDDRYIINNNIEAFEELEKEILDQKNHD